MSNEIVAIEAFMTEDHARIDSLLRSSERDDEAIDDARYARFRHDLLRHIAMEEKVLVPFARVHGCDLVLVRALHRDHGAIAKLLVRSPTREGIAEIVALLGRHNALEEGANGLYAICGRLSGAGADALVERLRSQPRVPLAPYYDGPLHSTR